MRMTEKQINLSAQAAQEAGQEITQVRFRRLLKEHEIVVTNERFRTAEIGSEENFMLTCHLQAPTIYDVAVRLAKAGWSYTDSTEDRAAPSLMGPAGETIRIIQEKNRAVVYYTPADIPEWNHCATDAATISRDKIGVLASPLSESTA